MSVRGTYFTEKSMRIRDLHVWRRERDYSSSLLAMISPFGFARAHMSQRSMSVPRFEPRVRTKSAHPAYKKGG